jgi:cyclohexanone monooxygenase
VTPTPTDPGLDPDALRAKYRAERDKRLRSDGNEQYVEIGGSCARFGADPYVEPGYTRAPLTDDVDVVLIGGGFGGLLVGARLRQLGVKGIRIVEKGGDFGGTWYWNRYPGVACDIESYVYMPLLEELQYVPREKYSRGSEIFAHCKAIAEKFALYRDVCFQTEVTEVQWDDPSARWIISTNRGDAMRARFVCLANGFLQKPKLPGIPGIETFTGHSFHTSRWDYAYTGGDSTGNLTGLRGKRVGIIGTGATAVQCVPHLGASAGHLYVFQRTPSSVDVRANRPTDPQWASSLEPGWHQKRMDNFHVLTAGGHQEEDLVSDGWTDVMRKLLSMMLSRDESGGTGDDPMRMMEMADFLKMEQVRARVASIVKDPATAEALKPYYRQFCKRPCFHDEYLQTFNRPNVTLVDTKGKGVERITATGVVADGTEYALDCLIFATGFEVGTDYARRAGYQLVGRHGETLTAKWRDGVRTLHGIHIHEFPNCFMMSISQSAFTVNFPYMIDQQAKQIAYVVDRALRDGTRTVEVTAAAEAEWVETIIARSVISADFAEQCTPGYYNNEGMPSAASRQNGFFFGGPMEFVEILEQWRADGTMPGLECR